MSVEIQPGRPITAEEITRAFALARRLAERSAPLDGETLDCTLCDQPIPYTYSTFEARQRSSGDYGGELACDQRAHAEDCPWRQARELLGIPLNRIEAYERERLGDALPAEATVWEFPS